MFFTKNKTEVYFMKRFMAMFLVLVMCIGCIPLSVSASHTRDVSKEQELAQQLKELGLFRGVSDSNFDLSREPTRVEALVMLIRVLGKESQAMSEKWVHPFTDVPEWADKYVGYAYCTGLTNGQSETLFGTGDATGAMYLTFVLRALGYSDTNGTDFTWDNPYTLAKEMGILTSDVNTYTFWRADVVIVSHNALDAYLKGSYTTLASKLIDAGVFTKETFTEVYVPRSANNSSGPRYIKDAFTNIVLNDNPSEFGYITNDSENRNGKNISYMEAYGCGNGAMGDAVQFKNIDFGDWGAKSMVISFAYGGERTTTIDIKLDSLDSEPIATYAITNTGGWDKTKAKEFTTNVDIPGGIHDVFVQFTNEESGAFSYIRFGKSEKNTTLTPEQIAATCSPAVFYVEMYDQYGDYSGCASGFFINPNGVAATNYHVIDGAYSAFIKLKDGRTFEITDVYDYDIESDWAVVQTNCLSSPYLSLGDSSGIVTGAKVYTIGSPNGLEDSMSDGIISTPTRIVDGVSYIQFTAPISRGSSGGALINANGSVIGITAAAFKDGESLNLAVPINKIKYYDKYNPVPLEQVAKEAAGSGAPAGKNDGVDEEEFSAFDYLATAIMLMSDDYNEENGYSYTFTSEDNSNNGFSVSYRDEDGEEVIEIMFVIEPTEGDSYAYAFEILPDPSKPIQTAYIHINDAVTNGTALGASQFKPADFSLKYNYQFDEYSGTQQETDRLVAKTMHAAGISFVNELLSEMTSGEYTIEDLGYSIITTEDLYEFIESVPVDFGFNFDSEEPETPKAEVPQHKKELAFNALADFITEEAQDYSHSFGYEYTHTYQDTSFTLAYNPDEDFIYVYFEMDDAALAFDIIPDSETATSIFGRYNSNGIRVSNGNAMVDITEFSNDYEYSFYEYKGDDKTYDEMMAKILHAGALSLIDVIFSSIDGSSYSITNLGYISYDYEF